MLYATLVKYFCDVPASDAVTFLGFPISGKIFIYSLALQVSQVAQTQTRLALQFLVKTDQHLFSHKTRGIFLTYHQFLTNDMETYKLFTNDMVHVTYSNENTCTALKPEDPFSDSGTPPCDHAFNTATLSHTATFFWPGQNQLGVFLFKDPTKSELQPSLPFTGGAGAM